MEINATTIGYGIAQAVFLAAGAMIFFNTLATQWTAGGTMNANTFIWYLVAFVVAGIGRMLWSRGTETTPSR